MIARSMIDDVWGGNDAGVTDLPASFSGRVWRLFRAFLNKAPEENADGRVGPGHRAPLS